MEKRIPEQSLASANKKLEEAWRALHMIRARLNKRHRAYVTGPIYAEFCAPKLRSFIITTATTAINDIRRD